MWLNAVVRLPRLNGGVLGRRSLFGSPVAVSGGIGMPRRKKVAVIEGKGKKGMMSRQYQRPPPPPLPKIEDDGNPKFVIFIRMSNVSSHFSSSFPFLL